MKTTAIITAAGKGSRANLGTNKLLEKIGDKTVLELALLPFDFDPRIDEIIVTASKEYLEDFKKIINCVTNTPVRLILGGSTRTYSVMSALHECDGDIVVIHDGARPFVSPEVIDRCIDGALSFGSGVAAISSVDTIGVCDGELIISTHRSDCCIIQTPQAFLLEEIKRAYSHVTDGEAFTDDAGVYSRYVKPAHMVEGDKRNVKLTFKEDFEKYPDVYCGEGFDIHPLKEGRKLVLGGVEIPHDKGLDGHSDADALLHALTDAVLSAAGLGDIGRQFPDDDEKYKDADSSVLLANVLDMVDEAGMFVKNVSLVVMAEKPKLAAFMPQMKARIACLLGIPEENVGISAKTLEGFGLIGREEAVACLARVLVQKKRRIYI